MTATRRGDAEGEPCRACATPNRPERSFCRHCGAATKPPKALKARSAPLARTAPERPGRAQGATKAVKPTKRPRPVSAKRSARSERRAEVVAFVHERDRTCRAVKLHGLIRDLPCSGALHVHERISRASWPKGYLEPDNCVLICANAHLWAHNHPNGAHALDLIRWSWERPPAKPSEVRDGHAVSG